MTKQSSTTLKYHKSKFVCDFRHEEVNRPIWKHSRVLTGHPVVFWRGNPKLQVKSFIWQIRFNRIEISYLYFCVILAMKGLISENAQVCSLSTLLYFEEATPSYKKELRNILHMTEQDSTAWVRDYNGLWIGHLIMLFVFFYSGHLIHLAM